MEEQQGEELKKQNGSEEKEIETPQAEEFSTDDYQDERDEKREFLGREEIRTMKKDISLLREGEAQKEKERLISLKVEDGGAKTVPDLRKEQEKRAKEEAERAKEARKAEESRRAEEIKREKEARKAEEARREKEAKQLMEKRRAEEKRAKEKPKEAEEARRMEEAKKAEETRKIEEGKRLEEERRVKEARKLEEEKKAEEAKKLEEEKRIEEERKIEEARKIEQAKRVEAARKIEEMRRADEKRKAEQMRKAEEARRAEEIRKVEEEKKMEEMRIVREEERVREMKRNEELRKVEEARRAEEMKVVEESRMREQARRAEEAKILEETKKTRELELMAEVKEAQEMERARETIKEKAIKREKELEETTKEEEGEIPAQAPEIYQEFSSFKPEGSQFLFSLKRVLIRFAIVAIIIVLEILAGFLYWYLTISPMETDQSQIETGIITPNSLITVRETVLIEASSTEDAALLLPQFLEKKLESNTFARILVKNIGENKIFELKDFFATFSVVPPTGFLEKLNSGFTLFVYSDNDSGRFGFVAKIRENEVENLSNIVRSWEPTMEGDFGNLFASLGKNGTSDNPYFSQTTYKGIPFRYLSFSSYSHFGICWSTFNNYFLWTSSGESMMRAIDALSE